MSFAAAIASGIALALSFPRYGHPVVAFVALAPLLFALSGWRGRPGVAPGVSLWRGFKLGLVTGFLHFAGTVYWTGMTVQTFGGLSWPVAVLVAGLLVLYMATYLAIASVFTGVFIRRFGSAGLFLAPAAWVLMEYLRGHLIGGFPWIPLGSATATLLPLAQLASITGVYGLSFLLAAINTGFVYAAISTRQRRLMAIAGTLVLILGLSTWGSWRISRNVLVTKGQPVTVGLIQGNIAQIDKWNPARAPMIVDRYLQLKQQAVDGGEIGRAHV